MLPEELDASFLEVGWDVCWAQCRVAEGDLQFLLELLDVCPAVCVAEHAGEMLEGVGVMVCAVVGGIGGIAPSPQDQDRCIHQVPADSDRASYESLALGYVTLPLGGRNAYAYGLCMPYSNPTKPQEPLQRHER